MATPLIERWPIGRVRPNESNPRFIKDDAFRKLVASLKQFPEMMDLRPVVVNEQNIILGGNMRYRAAVEAGWQTVPVVVARGLTPEQEREFIIKDNVAAGSWDMDMLANEWDLSELKDWGLDLPDWDDESPADYSDKNKEVDLSDYEKKMDFTLKLTSSEFFDLQERLSVVKSRASVDTNEQAIFHVLGHYERT